MDKTRAVVAVLILACHCMAVWSWTRVYWKQVDPYLRRVLGRRLAIRIIWVQATHGRAWGIAGSDQRRERAVAFASILAWMGGLFAPAAIVTVGIAVGWVPAPIGLSLLVAAICVCSVSGRAAAGSAS